MNTELLTTLTYALYLTAAGLTTVAITRLVKRHTAVFLRDGYSGDTAMAEAAGGLIETQFRLVAFAATFLLLRLGNDAAGPAGGAEVFEALSVKLGVILLVLGGLHFLSLRTVNRIRLTGDLL